MRNANLKTAPVATGCRLKTSRWLYVIVAAWCGVAASGMAWLGNYENSPGIAAHPGARWPSQSRISPNESGATLLMFAHPQCPCTRASIRELSVIMSRSPDSLRATILFAQPDGFDRQWLESDLWRTAAAIPRVSVMADRQGAEAAAFGAQTSGQVLLYNEAGELKFQGGITPFRGHSGDNAGRSAILAAANRSTKTDSQQSECFVFGCPLFSPGDLETASDGKEG